MQHNASGKRPPMVLGIQMLRFLAAAAVVVFHARPMAIPVASMPHGPAWLDSVLQMGFAGVDVFFVISGAIMALTTRTTAPGPRSAARFGLRRFGRIYAGWWPFFVLYLVAYAFMGQLGGKNLWTSFWLWPSGLQTHLLPITWTLTYELYFYLLLALAMLLPRTARTWAVALLGLAVAVCTALSWQAGLFTPAHVAESSILQQFLLSPLVAEFAAGYLLCRWLQPGTERAPASVRERAGWLAGAALLGFVASWYHLHVAAYPSGLAGYFHAPERALLLGGMAVCLVGWGLRAPAPQRGLGRALAAGGDASYAIYLAHMLVLVLGYKVLAWLAGASSSLLLAGGYVLMLVLVFAYSLWHYRHVELPLHRRIRALVTRLV